MNVLTLKLTIREMELLAALASDQMFRREFIDPKFPGYRANQGDLALGKGLVNRLRTLLTPPSAKKPVVIERVA